MSLITRKQQPKFTRKPYTIVNAIQQTGGDNTQEQALAFSSGKKLKISNNVLNLMVMAPQQNKQIQLSRLLFTNQKSAACSSARKGTDFCQNSTLTKRIFLEYSPDSIMESPLGKENMDDSEILIEGYSQKGRKEMVSTDLATNFTFQKSEKQGVTYQQNANITPFVLTDSQTTKIPASSITLSYITSNKFIFVLNYTHKSQAKNTLSQNSNLFRGDSSNLINRMRTFFKKCPLSMFVFYIEVLKQNQNIQLREFLMKNSIRYTTKQITSLEKHINIALDMCKGEELLEYMFMNEEEDDMIVVNLCNSNFQNQIENFQVNFWKALAPIFRHKMDEIQPILFQIQKIEEFLLRLI